MMANQNNNYLSLSLTLEFTPLFSLIPYVYI